ncbi:MAG: GDSL-type esterase/lipase family protein [Geitlerinemataceae cyanobacterium]
MIDILLLGDSITFGVVNGDDDDREQTGGYRTILFGELFAQGFANPTDFDFVGELTDGPGEIDRDHAGYRGATIAKIDDRVEELLLELPKAPDIVLLMAGTNDVAKGIDLDEAPKRLGELIDRLLEAEVDRVLIGSIPPLPERISASLRFNQALPGLAEGKGDRVQFVDVSGSLKNREISSDNVHPNARGYKIIGQNWAKAIVPIIGQFNTVPTAIETDDLLLGDARDNRLAGFGGQDTLIGFSGNDNLNGNTGNDIVFGNQGIDFLEGGKGDDTILGGSENDIISGNIGRDLLRGDNGDDILFGNTETDRLEGGAGNDLLLGGQADDTLDGGAGDDVLRGDRGNDALIGGIGRDRFDFRSIDGANIVLDFEDGQDAIGLTDLSFEQLTIFPDLNDTQIVFGNSTLMLQGVAASEIDESDFVRVLPI